MTMRVWAIWKRSRYVCFGLVATYLALSSVSIASIVKVPAQQDTFGADLHSAYGVCPPYFAHSKAIDTCFLALVAYESVLLALTLVKAIDMYRYVDVGTSSFIDIFFVDGQYPNDHCSVHFDTDLDADSSQDSYNGYILAGSTANIIVRYKTTPNEYINLLISLQPVFDSVLISRMMLHLKQNVVKSRQNDLLSIHSSMPSRYGGTTSETGSIFDVSNFDHARSWFGNGLRQTNVD
ncbi:hypothetical protein E1B28_012117 [Marasmius oreades]|uniref:Uncharacterized protein n=1 Tax=Marasmius oreades TaxID=181124 RepID=A0A9P7RQU0_9AGAR|nr:uncharacterized protein E1B28_012117 [Marasmius oreades]KAG7088091.1 hypothetical protein E1B28_012117 [Marasmius oreades]